MILLQRLSEIMKEKLQQTRQSYEQGALDAQDMSGDPLVQFQRWYEDYEKSQERDPNACLLATADREGRVTCRVLLLKGLDGGGMEFYTNYESEKAQQLEDNPQAALTFFWPELERQVRVEGSVEKLSASESDAYFYSRPRGSQLGAWTSPQSERIASREELEKRAQEVENQFPHEVPRPQHWGGYRLKPRRVEFWQGRPSRLHDRLCYQRSGEEWELFRLAP